MDVGVIRTFFQLEKTIELSKRTDINPDHLAGLDSYVVNLPGYKEGSDVIESTVYEQHGLRALKSISPLAQKCASVNFVNCWNLLRALFTTTKLETASVKV